MNYSKWALVTGSSDGIGRSLALELDSLGYNIIVHGRNHEKIDLTCSKLTNDHKKIFLDLSLDDADQRLISYLRENEIKLDILVNNAGFGVPGDFQNSNLEKEMKLIKLQCLFTTSFIKSVIREYSNRPLYILNVSSLYSFFPVPKQSIYGAVKAFMHSFSLSIYHEYKDKNIHVSSLCPGLTHSNFRVSQGKKDSHGLFELSSKYVAQKAISGLMRKKPEIIPGLFFKLMAFTIPKLPTKLGLYLIGLMNSSRGF